MYQSLYRKYRPLDFESVYGQEVAKKILINSIKNNKISHAYLFFGPRGTGKTSIAKMYARICNCLNNKNGVCCEECDNCIESKNKNCVDIIEIDAASNNGVDEIRELRNKITLVPNKLKYKVYIIDEVHMLSTGAFNALLKTLEEPPEHIVFILATTDYYKVPSTIISRCQTIEFKNIDNENMYKRIAQISELENISITENGIKEIVKNSNGGLRDAVGLLEKVFAYAEDLEKITDDNVREVIGNVSNDEIIELVKYFIEGKQKNLLDKLNCFANVGKDLLKIIDDILEKMLDLVLNEKSYDLIEKIKIINNYYNEMKKSNNQKILFEIMIIEICSKTNVRKNISREIIYENTTDSVNKKQELFDIIPNKKKNTINNDLINKRINNCFASANKQLLIDLQNTWKELKKYVFDSKIGSYVCDLLDCNPIVAGNKDVMLVTEYDSSVEKINQNLNVYENIIKENINLDQKIVVVSKLKWDFLKEDYMKKIKSGVKFEYIEEKKIAEISIKSSENNTIEQKAKELFGEILN